MLKEEKRIIFEVDICVEPDENGYHAFCPALKGLHVHGDTEQEALEAAKDAAIAYLESMWKHGDPIPLLTKESLDAPVGCSPNARLHKELLPLITA